MQNDLNLHILCMFEGTFSLGVVHILITQKYTIKPIQGVIVMIIAPDKPLFFNRKVLIFFLFLHKDILWVLIRTASLRHF